MEHVDNYVFISESTRSGFHNGFSLLTQLLFMYYIHAVVDVIILLFYTHIFYKPM